MFDKDNSTSFIDLLFNLLVCITILLFIAILMIKIESVKKEDVKALTKYMIVMTWDSKSNDDVDLYAINSALTAPIYFNNRSGGLMFLDHDDLGRISDVVIVNGVPQTVESNHEVIYIKDIIEGEYIFNVHMYSKRDAGSTKITIELYAFEPYALIEIRELFLTYKGEEQTIVRLTFDKNRKIISRSYLYKHLSLFAAVAP